MSALIHIKTLLIIPVAFAAFVLGSGTETEDIKTFSVECGTQVYEYSAVVPQDPDFICKQVIGSEEIYNKPVEMTITPDVETAE